MVPGGARRALRRACGEAIRIVSGYVRVCARGSGRGLGVLCCGVVLQSSLESVRGRWCRDACAMRPGAVGGKFVLAAAVQCGRSASLCCTKTRACCLLLHRFETPDMGGIIRGLEAPDRVVGIVAPKREGIEPAPQKRSAKRDAAGVKPKVLCLRCFVSFVCGSELGCGRACAICQWAAFARCVFPAKAPPQPEAQYAPTFCGNTLIRVFPGIIRMAYAATWRC